MIRLIVGTGFAASEGPTEQGMAAVGRKRKEKDEGAFVESFG